jgi:hypothetical protein
MLVKRVALPVVLAAALSACARQADLDKLPAGSEVTIRTEKGDLVTGRLVEAKPDTVVVARSDGGHTTLARTDVAKVEVSPGTGAPSREPAYKEITIPPDTTLEATLDTTVASDSSRVEDRVEAAVTKPVVIEGLEVVPAGSRLTGVVTQAQEAGRVKGRARIALRFDTLMLAERSERLEIETRPIAYEAPSTKKEDAKKIGIPAVAGAVVGAIVGGGGGAAKGAVIGGGAGTAYVLVTKGEEIRVNSGAPLHVRLQRPIILTVPKAAERQ